MLRKITTIVAALMLLCTGASLATEVSEEPKNTTLALIVEEGEAVELFPYQAYDNQYHWFLSTLVFDKLVEHNHDGVLEKQMAEEYSIENEYKTYRVTLREGLVWHDGAPVGAEDVAFSFAYAKNSDNPYLSYAAGHPGEVRVIDERTVEFSFSQSQPNFVTEALASVPMIPEHVYANGDRSQIVGSGGYRLVNQDEQGLRLIKAGDAYFRKQLVEEIGVLYLPGEQTAIDWLREGGVDAIINSLLTDTKDLVKGKTEFVSAKNDDGLITRGFLMNNRNAPFDDPAFRRALGRGIDYKKLVENAYNGNGKEGMPGFFHYSMQFANKESRYDTSVDQAKKDLEEAGYLEKDNLRLDKAGQPLRFSTLALSEEDERLAGKLAEQLKELGITLQVKRGTKEQLRAGQFETVVTGFHSDYQWDEGALLILFGEQSKRNVTGYVSSEWNQLGQKYIGLVDPTQRLELLHGMQEQIGEDLPMITLCYPSHNQIYNFTKFNGYVSQFGTGIFHKGSFYENAKTLAEKGNKAILEQQSIRLNPLMVGAIVLALVGGTILVAYLIRLNKKKES